MHLAIILKKEDRGEADELVVFLSRDLGWLRGVAKNSRKSRVRFGGHLEPLSVVELTLKPRRRDDMIWIEGSHVVDGFLNIRADIHKVAAASYFLELASMFMGEAAPDADLFDFLCHFLQTLNGSDPQPLLLLFEEIRLLGFLGVQPVFGPCAACGQKIDPGQPVAFVSAQGGVCHIHCVCADIAYTTLSPETVVVIQRALSLSPQAAGRLRLSNNGMDELRRALSSFVRFMSGHEIRSLKFLERIAGRPLKKQD